MEISPPHNSLISLNSILAVDLVYYTDIYGKVLIILVPSHIYAEHQDTQQSMSGVLMFLLELMEGGVSYANYKF